MEEKRERAWWETLRCSKAHNGLTLYAKDRGGRRRARQAEDERERNENGDLIDYGNNN